MAKLFISILLLFFTFPKPEKNWVAIGDSITYINDNLAETDNRVSKGYMTLVSQKLPQYQYINKGYNGWTVIQIANKWQTLDIPTAEIYTIFLGTNDWWAGNTLGDINDYKDDTGPSTVAGAYRLIIKQIRNINPAAKIVLISPMKRVDFVYYKNYRNNAFGSYNPKSGQTLEEFVNLFTAIARHEKLAIVDLFHNPKLDYKKLVKYKLVENEDGKIIKLRYPNFDELAFDPNTGLYPYPPKAAAMTYDGLHPSDAGYKVIADEVIKAFGRLE